MEQRVETPAGPIALTCTVEDVEPHPIRRSGTATIIEQWSVPAHLDVVVVLADVDPPLGQDHGPLDGYLGVVWSFRAHRPCGPITVGAHLVDPRARDFVGGNNGEWLEAVTYDSPTLALSIGTHDDQILRARAGRRLENASGSALPCSWAPLLEDAWQGEFGARGDARGVVVRVPSLGADERADLHVAVAWGPPGADVATWFAVDTGPDQILAAVAEAGRVNGLLGLL